MNRMCLTPRLAALAAFAATSAGAQPPEPAAVLVEVTAGVSSADAAHGARPTLRVAAPVVVRGDTAVAAGTLVHATVAEVVKEGTYGRPGRLRVRFDSTHTRAGRVLLLDGSVVLSGVRQRTAAFLVSWATAGIGGLAVRGGPATLAPCDVYRVRTTASAALPGGAVAEPEPRGAAPSPACAPAQTVAARYVPEKSAGVAVGMSLSLPGAGQIYADDTRRGAVMMGVAMTGAIVAFVTAAEAYGGGVEPDEEGRAATLLLGGIGVWFGTAIYSAVDAPSAVRRFNARTRGTPQGASRVTPVLRFAPAPRPGDLHASAPAFGLRIR